MNQPTGMISKSSSSSSNSSTKSLSSSSKLRYYVRAPIRALAKARDLYVSGLTSCARKGQIGQLMAYSAAAAPSRANRFNFRTSNNEDDISELIRSASVSRIMSGNGSTAMRTSSVVPRSQSVAVGRIDEDKQYDDFGDDFGLGAGIKFVPKAYPRSRSAYAVNFTNRTSIPVMA